MFFLVCVCFFCFSECFLNIRSCLTYFEHFYWFAFLRFVTSFMRKLLFLFEAHPTRRVWTVARRTRTSQFVTSQQ